MNDLIADGDYAEFRRFLEETSGIVLGDNKQYLIHSRLGGLLAEHQLGSVRELLALAARPGNEGLRTRVIDVMTTNETLWFRDSYPFAALRSQVLPQLAAGRPQRLRIWSAGCSTGEEPYSISMVLDEHLGETGYGLTRDIEILATDISSSVLERAQSALYDERSLERGVSEQRRDRFFVTDAGRWRLRDDTRRRVSFRSLNLKDSYTLLGRFDVIFCRNVLIYFSPELKRDIIQRMTAALNPRGFLVLGSSESPTSYSDALEMVRCERGVIYRLKP